jgi:hypothetical protein
MSLARKLDLTAALLFVGGLFIAAWCVFTSTYNGAWLLAVLMVAGFVGITCWTAHRD